jgi:hypothetical protein
MSLNFLKRNKRIPTIFNPKDFQIISVNANNIEVDELIGSKISSVDYKLIDNTGSNTDEMASKSYVDGKINDMKNGVSNSYDTLKEIESYLNDNTTAVNGILTTLNTRATTSALINTNQDVSTLTGRVSTLEQSDTQQASFINQLWTNKQDKSDMTSYYTKTESDNLLNGKVNNSQLTTSNNRITALETSNTQNISDIDILKTDNTSNKSRLTSLETNKSDISYVDNKVLTAIEGLINNSPQALDTLNELASALGNDPNFATTITNNLASKANQTDLTTTNNNLTTLSNNLTNNYLTTSNASSTYQTISGMSSYLTTSSASSIYQTISGMTSYLSTSSASSIYQTISGMSSFFNLSSNNNITGSNTFNNVQTLERICEQITQGGSGTNLSLSYTSIRGIIVYAPSANFTFTLTNLPTTNINCVYTLTFIYSTRFYASSININGTSYTMTAIGGLSNISINSSASRVYQQIQIIFNNSSTPTVSTSVLSLW